MGTWARQMLGLLGACFNKRSTFTGQVDRDSCNEIGTELAEASEFFLGLSARADKSARAAATFARSLSNRSVVESGNVSLVAPLAVVSGGREQARKPGRNSAA